MDKEGSTSKEERLKGAMMNLMMRMKEVDDRCAELNEQISKRELFLIAFVGDQRMAIMKEIAEYLDVPLSTATGIVEKLVKKEILARGYSARDRRTVQVLLNEAGKHIYDNLSKMRLEMIHKMLSELESYETDTFIRLIEKVSLGLQKRVDAE